MLSVLVFGASSQIARDTIDNNWLNEIACDRIVLFGRSVPQLESYYEHLIDSRRQVKCATYNDWFNYSNIFQPAIALNFVGRGSPKSVSALDKEFLLQTDRLDRLLIDWAEQSSERKYIYFSSGAVYGSLIGQQGVTFADLVSAIDTSDIYRKSKLNAEDNHSRSKAKIIDLRIFCYCPKQWSAKSDFFVDQLISHIKSCDVMTIDPRDFKRDFCDYEAVRQALQHLITRVDGGRYDISSSQPISKLELLKSLAIPFGLNCFPEVMERLSRDSEPSCYFPFTNSSAQKLQFCRSSKDVITNFFERSLS